MLAKYTPAMSAQMKAAHATMRKLVPGAVEMVYGNRVRHYRLAAVSDLNKRPIRKLITLAIAQADPPFDPGIRNTLVIKSISAKQRPRRPAK